MPSLHLYSIELFTVLTVLVAGAAMLLASTVNRSVHGVKRCAASAGVLILGMLLYSGRLLVPGRWIIFLPNPVVLGALLILLDGVRVFRGFPRRVGWSIAGMVVYLAAHAYWLFWRDDINARTAVHMAAIIVWSVAATRAMAVGVAARDRGVYWSTGAGFALFGVAAAVKGVDAVWGGPIQFWTGRTADLVFLGATNLCVSGVAFGLSMATNLNLQRETERLARFDSLTRLPNRRHFEELLEEAERRADSWDGRGAGRIALVYCDLDDFKGINDKLGHEGGDQALRMVGEKLRALAGEGIAVARVGGDEFALLVQDAPGRRELNALVEEVREAVRGSVEFGGRSARVDISCGLAVYPEDVGSVSDLVRLGDAAMYMMKQHGRVAGRMAADER